MSRNLSSTEQRAIELLGDGHTQADVAAAIGVTESRISQLMGEESFRSQVIDKRIKSLQADSDRHGKVVKAQDLVLDKIIKVMPLVHKPMELTRMFEVLNRAAQATKTTAAQTTINQKVVVLNMPTKVIHKYTKNSLGQIIEVNDVPITTAPNTVLYKSSDHEHKQIPALDAEETGQLKQLAAPNNDEPYIPGSSFSADDL